MIDKILPLINSLIKSKIIKDSKLVLCVVIVLCTLYFSNYVERYLNETIKETVRIEISNVFNQREKERSEKHAELVNTALTIPPKIDNELRKLQQTLKADRAFFCEYGNSLTSLSGNLFTYFTMRNEQNASGVAGIKQQYQQQSTDNFRFNVELNEKKVYNLLDIENIKESDPILYTMVKKNGAKQLFLYLIEIDGTPRGFIGISYSKESPLSHDQMFYYITTCARAIIDLAIVKGN